MRNPNRIPAVLAKLTELWYDLSDWRFMQLVCNIQGMIGNDGFYMEDEELIKFLDKWINERKEFEGRK